MALIQSGKDDLLTAVRRESIYSILPLANWQLSPVVPGEGGLAKIRLTPLAGVAVRGSGVYQYNRRHFKDLASKYIVPPRIKPQATLYAMLPYLTDIGLGLTQDDVLDSPVVSLSDGTFELTLTAKPMSIGWYGTGKLVVRNLPPISLAIVENNLNWG